MGNKSKATCARLANMTKAPEKICKATVEECWDSEDSHCKPSPDDDMWDLATVSDSSDSGECLHEDVLQEVPISMLWRQMFSHALMMSHYCKSNCKHETLLFSLSLADTNSYRCANRSARFISAYIQGLSGVWMLHGSTRNIMDICHLTWLRQ